MMAPAALVSTVRRLAALCCWQARTRREARLIASVAALARRHGRRAAYRALRWWAVERRRERGRRAMWALAVEVSLERGWACWRRFSVKEARRARASSAPVLWALAPWARAVRSTTVQRLRRSWRRWVRRCRADAPQLHSHRQGMRAAGRFRKRIGWLRLKVGAAADAERWRLWINVEAIALAHAAPLAARLGAATKCRAAMAGQASPLQPGRRYGAGAARVEALLRVRGSNAASRSALWAARRAAPRPASLA